MVNIPATDLAKLYECYRASHSSILLDISDNFSAPLLVNPPEDWISRENRILYIGQETLEWCFIKEEMKNYPETWDRLDIHSLRDFFQSETSVDALMYGYEQFEFAAHEPKNLNGPFWRYFRKMKQCYVNQGKTVSALFTNVIRCAAASEAGRRLSDIPTDQASALLKWQQGLLRTELEALMPTLILFVSGPNYDEYLFAEFDDLSIEPLGTFNQREAAVLQSKALPAPAYRTYHPGYLSRNIGFAPLTAAIEDSGTL